MSAASGTDTSEGAHLAVRLSPMDDRPSATNTLPWSSLLGRLRTYAVFTMDLEGIIDSWNAGVREVLGYEEHEFIGEDGRFIFTPEDRAKGIPELEMAIARERGEATDDRWHLRKDGSRLWVNGIMHCVRDRQGAAAGYLKIMRDVTEKRSLDLRLGESEERFSKAFRANPTPTAILSQVDGLRVVDVNEAFVRAFGTARSAAVGATLKELGVDAAESEFDRARVELGENRSVRFDAAFTSRGNEQAYGTFALEPIELGGEPHAVMLMHDVTPWRAAQDQLERQAREQGVLADLTVAALEADTIRPVLDVAVRRVAETVGADRVHVSELTDAGTSVRSHYPEGEGPGAGEPPGETEFRSSVRGRIQGRERPFGFLEAFSRQSGFFSEEDESFVRSVAYLLAGAVEQLRLHRELAHRADHDDLTGLLTRVAFERRLVQALERAARTGSKVAVLFLDLDRFKNVNDSLGHQAGDEVLRAVARRLSEAVRSWDVLARHGGDEFVLFLPEIESSTEVAHVTTRLIEAFATPFKVAGRELRIMATIGVATFPDDGKDATTLLRAADTALYEGKTRGRNSFHFFTREQHERVLERLEFETYLQNALDHAEFELQYQPQVDLEGGHLRVAEALIRWRHPKRGRLAPAAFLPVVEQIGLAAPVGEWALMRAFRDHAAWRTEPAAPERVAVNVSTLHFLQPSFPEVLRRLAAQAGLAAREVEIEIDESTLLKDPELVELHLRELASNGIRIVLDDFGTEASPLSRLRDLPIDGLKVDGTFIRAFDEPRGRRLLEAIVQVALSLGIEPIAEGVETSAQDEAVRAVGFRAAQGRFYAEEVGANGLLEQLRARRG